MKNIRIGVRLSIGFGVLIALSVIMAAVGFFRLQASNDTIGVLINGTYPKILVVSEMRESNDMGARNLRNVLLASSPKDKDEKLKRMFEMEAKGAASFKKLQGMTTSSDEREMLQKISDKYAAYVELRAKVFTLLDSGDKDAAVSFMFKPGVPAFNAYNEAVTDFMNFEKKAMDQEAAATFVEADQAKMMMIGGALTATILGSVLAFLITRSITKPLQQALTVAEAVASGDLTSRIETDASDETGQLVRALKRMNENLARIVTDVRNGTDTVAAATTEIAAGNMELSARTEQQASALEETASSMEEMNATVKQSADNARQANQLAASAVQVAGKGGTVVAQVVDTIAAISESSKKVGNIIEVINGIAFQTNILALNAAVEAARAGEQGKGFAVVAGEVRNLAQRSAAAAKEIKELIEASNGQVQTGTQLATQAGVAMSDIVGSIKRVTDVVSEIAAASQEQTGGIDQINQAIIQIDQVTQQNAALVEEAAAASSAMQEQAETLKQAVSVFKLDEKTGYAARA